MYELLMIHNNGNFEKRIFPIVLKDSNIYTAIGIMSYVKYWNTEINLFEKNLKDLPLDNQFSFKEDHEFFSAIKNNIKSIADVLKNINALTSFEHTESNFKDLVFAIKEQKKDFENIITPEEIVSFSQENIRTIGVLRTLSSWLDKNTNVIIDQTMEEFLITAEEYSYVTDFTDSKILEQFKTSVTEHVNWIKQMFLMGTNDVEFKDYVSHTDLLYMIQKAYSKFFLLMLDTINSQRTSLSLGKAETDILLEYIDGLYLKYS